MTDAKRARVAELEAELGQLRAELGWNGASASDLYAGRAPQAPLPAEAAGRPQGMLHTIERLAQLGNWTWDLHSNHVAWSSGMYRILGLDPAEVRPCPTVFYARIHPDDRAYLATTAQRGLEAGVVEPVEARVVRPTGELREVLLEGIVVHDGATDRTRVAGSLLDLTDSRRSARRLAEAVAELNEAQRLAKLASWRMDVGSNQYTWSDHMFDLLGVPRSLAPSDALFSQHVHPEERARLAALRQRAQLTNDIEPFESRLVHSSGKVLHVICRAAAQSDASGATVGYRGVIQDITERKVLEEQLRHSQKMEAIGTLAGGVAHDFNNYLMIISSHTERLSRLLHTEHPAHRSVCEIAEAYQRCAQLTQQLLTLSHKRKAQPENVNLAALVDRLSTLVCSALGAGIQLQLQLPQSGAVIFADPLQIEHLLMNLVVNARDAMPTGGALRIGVEPLTDANTAQALVRLTVSDEGCGIPQELHARVFEPFFTTKQLGQGTGLGLSTVYAIVHEGGGHIEFDSTKGQGTTFRIHWPAHAAALEPAPQPNAGVSSALATGQSVLLVEDVPQLRDILTAQLEHAGYRVLCVGDGLAALDLLGRERVDLVLSDMVMPKLGGAALAEAIRAGHSGVRCLLMTGYHADASRNHADQPLLRKPFSTEELIETVQAVLRR